MPVAADAPPETGEIVRVRSRRYLVEGVVPPPRPEDQTLVHLSCLEDDAEGEELSVLWEKELDSERMTGESWAKLTEGQFDNPRDFAAYYHTLRWNTVTATEPIDLRIVCLERTCAFKGNNALVSTFVLHQAEMVFKALADRMCEIPELRAQLFVHVGRKENDRRHDSEILREYADKLRKAWPGPSRPFLYYDPRSLATGEDRATWHAKVVVIDEETSFVTSANFTQWAQERNVEAGVLIRNAAFARQLRQQFDSLVQSRAVIEVPGFRS